MNFESKKQIGALGEKLGCDYLKRKGYSIIETNYRNSFGYQLGEIDIVAEKDNKIIFVEVKTRKDFGPDTPLPEQNITGNKLRKLQRIAQIYIKERKREKAEYAFDALSILVNLASGKAKVRHLESIFL